MANGKEYYKVLQVDKNASREEIRASYRRLAKSMHPDLHPGKPEYQEIFQKINEAYEVLGNDILRKEYDESIKLQEEWIRKQRDFEQHESVSEANKKTYTKKNTYNVETRIHITGKVEIKYQANGLELLSPIVPEIFLKIIPLETKLFVLEEDVFSTKDIPQSFLRSYSEAEIFKTPIPQPVNCIIKTSNGEEYYKLSLQDIRIRNIELSGITKHESQSFGTLTGDLFAYHPKIDVFEEHIEVVECFGPTGKTEWKYENGTNYQRKEFYNPDCSTSWGSWIIYKKPAAASTFKYTVNHERVSEGCTQYWWVPFFLILGFIYPQIFLLALFVLFIWGITTFGSVIFRLLNRFIPLLILFITGLFLYAGIRSFGKNSGSSYVKKSTVADTINITKRKLFVETPPQGDTSAGFRPDTLITQHIKWANYNNEIFETDFTITLSSLRTSVQEHFIMNRYSVYNSLAPVYAAMVSNDSSKLGYIYNALDSLKINNNLDRISFARTIVSCIQSIPYYLILEGECNQSYNDEFIRQYLSNCTSDCCLGNEKFGVRTPVEFISDLKGDCDTRSLLIFSILKHYNYKVALITSLQYKHAMVAVHEPSFVDINGVAMDINGSNYYLWETTSKGYDIGDIPLHLQNLDYWDVALLN